MQSFPEVFSIIDTETTGMRPPYSRVMDIGIIRVEHGKVVERFSTLINPGSHIPPSIQRFTNITPEDLVRAPAFEDIALTVEELLKDSVFVAHNAAFDYNFIKHEFSRIGMKFSAEQLCTVALSRALYPGVRGHSLDAIIERHGLTATVRHRALPDAEAVWDFMRDVAHRVPEEEVARAVMRVRKGSASVHEAQGSLKELPDSAGVYLFYGPEDELLYIGKSKHVRSRARSHFRRTDTQGRRITDDAAGVRAIETSGELSALILEAALIKKAQPLYNRALRKRKMLVVAREHVDESGYKRVSLERVAAELPGEGVLSIFRTSTQGKTVLRRLAKEHALCSKLLGVEEGAGACFSRQLGVCDGACVGKIPADTHNERLDAAFSSRKLRTWPYRGSVLITEAASEDSGTIFLIDNWILKGAYRYEGEAYSPLTEGTEAFEYDTYKILVRYLANARNKRSVRVLSAREHDALLARLRGEEEVVYERD